MLRLRQIRGFSSDTSFESDQETRYLTSATVTISIIISRNHILKLVQMTAISPRERSIDKEINKQGPNRYKNR